MYWKNPKQAFREWVRQHDDRWSFILLYLVLAVTLSVSISLFWLLVVVGLHAVVEWLCQREQYEGEAFSRTLGRVIWAIKLDLTLILFSLLLGIYMDVMMGIAGLGSITRTGVQGMKGGARFLVWEKALKAILLSLDDLAQVFRAFFRKRGPGALPSSVTQKSSFFTASESRDCCHASGRESPWQLSWTFGDRVCLLFALFCLGMLWVSPWLSGHDVNGILRIMAGDLHPWP